jgi:putative glutathione S-transferase
MSTTTKLPASWHNGPEDSFHGKITADGPFTPDKGRYHLYIGLFCPFAHRANLVLHLKQLNKYADIGVSVVRPYPKGTDGWRFNVKGEPPYEDATEEPFYGVRFVHELYFKVDPDYKGKYTVPVLWDKKLETIVNNESHELLRDLQTAFNTLLPDDLADMTLYPEQLHQVIDTIAKWMQADLNTGVYKAGFAPDQETYEKLVPGPFAALNKLEKLAAANRGPYLLSEAMTELDIRAYATLIRFDTVYVQHFKCNLGTIRHDYPVLNNWMKNLYHNNMAFKDTTNFRHIKENYTKSHADINPKLITPVGPWPHVEEGYERDWSKLRVGEIDMPEVLEWEKKLEG